MEGYTVNDRDEQERPVAAAFGDGYVARVVYGKEDVCCAGEVGEGVFQGERVGRLHEHEGHGGAEEDDVGGGVFAKFFALQVSFLVSKIRVRCGRGSYSSQKAIVYEAYVSR